MLKKCQKTLDLPMKNTRLATTLPPTFSPSCIHSKRLRVCRHHAHMLKTHVRVVPAYTGVFSVSHTTHHTHPTHHNPPQPPHHTETDTERQRQGEKRRRKGRRQRRQDNRRENREDSFSVWWCHGRFFVDVVIFWLIPFAHEACAC